MGTNRVFLPAETLRRWIDASSVEIIDSELRLRSTGERYLLEEAVHVVAQVTDGGDGLRLVGRVRTVLELRRSGAELLERALVVGDTAYDVTPGFLASPLEPPSFRVARDVIATLENLEQSRQMSDEELLAQYLARKLD